jgi:hypothetical protein
MLFLMALALIVLGITAYRIAALYAPPVERPRRVPTFGRHRPADVDEERPASPGVNGWPSAAQVAAENRASQIAGAAEVQLLGERDQWWEEQRADGLTDQEIEAKEASQVVPVFEDA